MHAGPGWHHRSRNLHSPHRSATIGRAQCNSQCTLDSSGCPSGSRRDCVSLLSRATLGSSRGSGEYTGFNCGSTDTGENLPAFRSHCASLSAGGESAVEPLNQGGLSAQSGAGALLQALNAAFAQTGASFVLARTLRTTNSSWCPCLDPHCVGFKNCLMSPVGIRIVF